MKVIDYLYINGGVYFDDLLNGWYRKYGSYEVYITFENDYYNLDIKVKKYGHVIGSQTIENDVTPNYIEGIVAKIICEEKTDNNDIIGWALYTNNGR